MKRMIKLFVSAALTISLCIAISGLPLWASAEGSGGVPGTAPARIDERQFGNTGIEECRAAAAGYLDDIHAGLVPRVLVWEVTSSKVMGDDDLTTYNGDVQVNEKDAGNNPIVLDLNGKDITINGNLNIFGTLDVHNGSLLVTGNITVFGGLLKVTEASTAADGLVTVRGNYVTDGRDHTGALTAGMLDVRGDFIQYADFSPKAFCPSGTFKVKLSGTNKMVYFDTPSGSWLSNYEFVTGTTFKADSVFSLNLNLAANTVMTYTHLYIRGAMNGKTLTVPANTVIAGMLTLGGGQLTANGTLLVDYYGGFTMANAADRITVAGSFITGGQSICQAGLVEINGNFTQYGLVTGFHDDAYVCQPAHKTKITGTGRKILFDSPATSYFGQLDMTGTTWTSDSVMSLNCDLTADTVWTYPVVYYGGHLNGHDLTVTNNLYARQITPGGGTLTAEKNFTSIAADCLVMTNANDEVIVKGNFISNKNMSPASITAGLLTLQGGFTQSGGATTFLASGTHKTIISGAGSKSIVFANPGTSWFSDVEVAPGTTFAAGSVLSMKCGLSTDRQLTVPVLYFSGELNGSDLGVTGNLHLFGTVNPEGGSITATGNVTLDGALTMAHSDDRLAVDGDFTGTGTAALSAGTSEFKKSFRYTGSSWAASDTHVTTLSGGAAMPVIFNNTAQSWFAGVTVAAGTTFSADSVLSIKTPGNSDLTLTVPVLWLQGNLSGHKLTLTGSLNVPSGASLTIGGGTAVISGSLTLDNSTLVMTNANDKVTVGGSFTARGPDHTAKLTNGMLTVKGDFTQLSTNSQKSFHATGSHVTVFAGTATQHVNFATPHATTGSRFANVYRLNDDVVFETVYISDVDELTSADLRSLTGTGGVLVPAFSPDVTDYIYVLPKGTTATTLSALTEYQNASMTMDGSATESLAVNTVPYGGNVTVEIIVSAVGDVLQKTYTVKVEQLNLDLADITITGGVLDTAFDPDDLDYTVAIPANVDKVTITPVKDHPDATFTINGQAITTREFTVKPGETVTATIVVTGQDGTSQNTYTVEITRAHMLTTLGVTAGTLTPAWSSPVADYTLNLTALEETVSIGPVKAPGCDKVEIDGVEQVDKAFTLKLGEQRNVVIIATAGSVNFTYNVTIRRAPIISGFGQSPSATTVLAPAFDADVEEYTLTVPASVINVSITPQKGLDCTKLLIDEDATDGITPVVKDSVMLSLPVGGSRVLTIVAEAGTLIKTYTLTVTKGAIVTGLAMSQGTLAPAFSTLVTAYTVNVPATTAAVSVVPTLSNGSCTVNGQAWNPASPVTVNPAPGETATLTVVGTDGSASVTYTVTVRRDKPLSGFTLSSGTLAPAFNTRTRDYTVTVPAATTSVTISPTMLPGGFTSLTIDDIAQDSITLSPVIGVKATAVIKATGPDGSAVTTYTVSVLREALLADIRLSTGTLSTTFDGGKLGYAVFLPNNVTSVTLTPVKTASCSSFTINNAVVSSIVLKPASGGMAYANIVALGANASLTQTYIVRVYRIAPVTGITLSTGTLSPAFDINKSAYTVNVPATTASVTLTPVKAASCATMLINGLAVSNVTLSPKIGCKETATIIVEAKNGQDFTYTVTVNRAPLLRGITLSTGTLSPVFSAATTSYAVLIPATTSSVKVTPLKATTGVYSMKINGNTATSITLSPAVGSAAQATITLVASDKKTTQTYTVIVRRAPLITGISATTGTISPAFSTYKTAYTVTIPADATTTTLSYTKAATGVKTVTMNGAAVTSLAVPLPKPGGSAVVTIVATATNGTTKSTITVTVKRASVLSGITVAGGTLSPAFNPLTASYNVSIPAATKKVTLTPVRATGCTSVKIDGVEAVSKEISPPIGGSITATITASTGGGAVSTYTVKVTRAALVTGIRTSSTAYKISPAFSATTTGYTVSIPATMTSITIYATKAATGVKSMTMNGKAVTSLLIKPPLGGSYPVVIVATAPDGITKITYRVTVKRAGLLSGITADGATVTPTFNTATRTYTVIIPATKPSVKITATGASAAKTIKINGVTTSSVTLAPAVGGTATAAIAVTATDGVTKDSYIVIVRRVAPINSITLSTGTLSPVFDPAVLAYTVTVPTDTATVTVTPNKVSGTFTINGDYEPFVVVEKPTVGNTATVTIVATAGDGVTKLTYTITITWE